MWKQNLRCTKSKLEAYRTINLLTNSTLFTSNFCECNQGKDVRALRFLGDLHWTTPSWKQHILPSEILLILMGCLHPRDDPEENTLEFNYRGSRWTNLIKHKQQAAALLSSSPHIWYGLGKRNTYCFCGVTLNHSLFARWLQPPTRSN